MELPISGTWSFTGSMGVSRALHTATLMAGGKVLVAGGYAPAAGVVSATAEIYDSVLGTWSSTTSMSTGRNSSTATLLSDGRVLLAGGVSEEGVQPALKARRGTKATLEHKAPQAPLVHKVLPGSMERQVRLVLWALPV